MNDGKPTTGSIRPFGHRSLTTDEEHLWSLVARTIRPLRQGKKSTTAARYKADIRGAPRSAKSKAVDPEVTMSRQRTALGPSLTPIVRREKQQLARGRVAIDARIDLHGMTQAEAHGALRRFLHRAQASGAKFVLVITGKGAPNAPHGERGVLRQQVPLWLALPEFRRYVLGFDLAHMGHGGDGALYVRLRKARVIGPQT
jgi:DNA-nicking Smr family endonuclease